MQSSGAMRHASRGPAALHSRVGAGHLVLPPCPARPLLGSAPQLPHPAAAAASSGASPSGPSPSSSASSPLILPSGSSSMRAASQPLSSTSSGASGGLGAARDISARAAAPAAEAATTVAAPQPEASTSGASSASYQSLRVPPGVTFKGPHMYVGGQRVHSLSERGKDVIRSMEGWAQTELPRFLKPVDKSWQPSDLLPDSSSPDFLDEVQELRKAAALLPLDYLVVLVGDMVTEEALPSYMNMLNLLDETKDETGAADTPWASWTRQWTAEENRHGDVLNRYLYLSGKVDMRAVEVTIQNLIGNGLDPKLENNPYLCFVYTSFQERATKISHGNTARLAHYHGDTALAKLCGLVAADEGRHEIAYSTIVGELFNRDPDGAMLAFADMMKKGIVMPAHFLDDGWHSESNQGQNLFVDYATVADSIGVYTTMDYASIVDHLVDRWDVRNVAVVSGEAAEAQEYLVAHSQRIRRLAELQAERRLRDRKRGKVKSAGFSWINKKEVPLV